MEDRQQEYVKAGKSETAMPSHSMIILAGAALAVLFGGMMIYLLIKENTHPAWLWIIVAFTALMFSIVTISFLPRQEEKLADRLSHDSQAGHAIGKIVELRRRGAVEGNTMHQTGLELQLLISKSDGSQRIATLEIWVEDALLSNFSTGRTVHVLYDQDDPSKVAIDRRQTPVQVQ